VAIVKVSNAVGQGIRITGLEFKVPQLPVGASDDHKNEHVSGHEYRTTHYYSGDRVVVVDIYADRDKGIFKMLDVELSKNDKVLVSVTDIDAEVYLTGAYKSDAGMWGKADLIFGNRYGDVVFANNGSDTLHGNRGNDVLYGESGNDRLLGQKGHDVVAGGQGNDLLMGHLGKDKIEGGQGVDTLDGGFDKEADVFLFNHRNDSSVNAPDILWNFRKGDLIDLDLVSGPQLGFSKDGAAAHSVWVKEAPKAGGIKVMVDVNGDARADMALLVLDRDVLRAEHFLF
jgi:hypothetical protein